MPANAKAGEARLIADSDKETAAGYLKDADSLFTRGQYFESARYAFAASEENDALQPEAYARMTLSLAKAGLHNSATYFFIRVLQSRDKAQIRRVLTITEDLISHVGGDLLRPYLIGDKSQGTGTVYEDYDLVNRSAYLYYLGKDALLRDNFTDAIGYFNAIGQRSKLYPYALQLRATAYAVSRKEQQALSDFRNCQDHSSDIVDAVPQKAIDARKRQAAREAEDLHARCVAGEARTLYQMGRFEEADRVYDRIPKGSFVWPDILFEQAWNSFGKQEYNRSLGKLVSYKSPALKFVYNSEIDVLRAQSYFALCLYKDVNDVVNEFDNKYKGLAQDIKRFVDGNPGLLGLYDFGRGALKDSLYSSNLKNRLANRFVRSPYFQNLVASEREINREALGVRGFASMRGAAPGKGFAGFLEHVLGWRIKVIRMLGGSFVHNSLIDHHKELVANDEKMRFIKIEMLRRGRDQILKRPSPGLDRSWGNIEPSRRDDQYYWSFNGEFWNDELGDYVFGLESQCGNKEDG